MNDALKKGTLDFHYLYHNSLKRLFGTYLTYLKYPIPGMSKTYAVLTEEETRKKYLVKDFPDDKFRKLFLKAVAETNKKKMVSYFEKLTNYVLKKMGGFEIDGWKLKSKTTK